MLMRHARKHWAGHTKLSGPTVHAYSVFQTCVISCKLSVSGRSLKSLYINSSRRSWFGESPFDNAVGLLPLASVPAVLTVTLETLPASCFRVTLSYSEQQFGNSEHTALWKSFLRNVYSIGLKKLVPNLKKSKRSAKLSGRIAPFPNWTWKSVMYQESQHSVKIPSIVAKIMSARLSEAIERFRGSADISACLRMFFTCLRMTINIRPKQNNIRQRGTVKHKIAPVMW